MKYLILGAGPAGLTFANRLKQLGENSFLVLEAEKEAGGLCRSVEVAGKPLDIGGGHFLDIENKEVNDFLFDFMPEAEWNLFERNSKIDLRENVINSPIEANIWQLDLETQVEYLKSIAVAGCNLGTPLPEKFIDWIYWKLGSKIAEVYMLPYNKKMFANELNELGTYWLNKLPNVSFEDTLMSCLKHQAFGSQPAHARFYYPKEFGYGEIWLRMAQEIADNLFYNHKVNYIDFDNMIVKTEDGDEFCAENIITTIPWTVFEEIVGMPEELVNKIPMLKASSIEIRYFDTNLDTDAHWIYCPDETLPYHRILVRHNFCPNSKGYWTESRVERTGMFSDEAVYKYVNPYAYPLNTIEKPGIVYSLLSYGRERHVYGLGRWGEHEHYNSDVVVARALHMAEQLLNK